MKRLPVAVAIVLDILLVPVLLPVAWWVARREAQVLRDGIALNAMQAEIAATVGIRQIARVRVALADVVPLPLPTVLQRVAQSCGLMPANIAGMTLGYGIALRQDCREDIGLLVHELVHVAQYERLGGIISFLRLYLRECVWPGYPLGSLEVEAHSVARGSTGQGDVIPYRP